MKYKISKIVAHVLCWLPLSYLVFGACNRRLGADPQEVLLHLLGFWTLIFLLLSLSISPLRQMCSLPILIRFRRMLGLYAAFYLSLHIIVFFVFYLELNLSYLWDEIIERPYITVGMLATLMIIPLVATSTLTMQKRLGRNWKRIHKVAYVIPVLGIVHFIWQSKSDLNEPLLYAIWLVLLFVYRVSEARKR